MKMTVILFTVCVLSLSGCSPKPKTTDNGRDITNNAPLFEQSRTAAESELKAPVVNSYKDIKAELVDSPVIEEDEENEEKNDDGEIDNNHHGVEKLRNDSFAKESNQTAAAAHLTAPRAAARSAAGRLNALFEESEREPEAVSDN
jgi:hypothetical protein